MKASIKEVARLAGVSVATVSHVLNKTKNVRPETRTRVEQAVTKLNYQINPMARNLRRGETKTIGFVVANMANYYYLDIARGLEQRLLKSGYRPLLIDSQEEKHIEIENVKNLLASAVDGLVIAPTTEDFSYLKLLIGRRHLPVVFVDRRPTGFEGDLILATNEQGAYQAVKMLIAKGHREVAFIGSRYDSTMMERVIGYRRALTEAGIPVNTNYIKMGAKVSVSLNELRHGTSFSQTRELLELGSVTAIFSGNNLASIGVFTCLREMGVQVPQEVAFMTFDDDFWLTMTTPSISAVAQKPGEIGKVAGDIMIERLLKQAERIEGYHNVRVSTRLILRESC